MTVKELIKLLQKANDLDAVVIAYNGDIGKMQEISGLTYDDLNETIELQFREPPMQDEYE